MERRKRREWEVNRTAETIGSFLRLGNRSSYQNRALSFGQKWISTELQSRYRKPQIKIGNRDRWERSLIEKSYIKRFEEDKKIKYVRVESIEVYERGSNEQSFKGIIGDKERDQGYVELYDLQIENHPSYFANGIAVHNCHQLTKDAQNALLKMLEDTPKHTHFVLCTTEPQKLLPTIKGRCSQFQLTTLSEQGMFRLIRKVSHSEGEKLDRDVIDQIVQDSLGHPRDALQILEQVLQVDPEMRLSVAKKTAEEQSESIALCRALIAGKPWNHIRKILQGLKSQDPERIRRHVLAYSQSVLLNTDNERVGRVMEEFLEPFYDTGFPGLVYASYAVVKT